VSYAVVKDTLQPGSTIWLCVVCLGRRVPWKEFNKFNTIGDGRGSFEFIVEILIRLRRAFLKYIGRMRGHWKTLTFCHNFLTTCQEYIMHIYVPWPMAMLFLVDHTQGFYVFGEPRLSTNQGRVWQLWNLGPPWWCWRHTSALLISEIQPVIVWINRPDQWSANLSDSGTPATSLNGESPSPPLLKYLMKHDMMCR